MPTGGEPPQHRPELAQAAIEVLDSGKLLLVEEDVQIPPHERRHPGGRRVADLTSQFIDRTTHDVLG